LIIGLTISYYKVGKKDISIQQNGPNSMKSRRKLR
jgi:hypothetical protein